MRRPFTSAGAIVGGAVIFWVAVLRFGAWVEHHRTPAPLLRDLCGDHPGAWRTGCSNWAPIESTPLSPLDPKVGVLDVAPRAPIQLNNPPRCLYQDGTSMSGTCMFDEEFNGNDLDPAKWVKNAEFFGPLNDIIPEITCVTADTNTVSGGVLRQIMVAGDLTSCPQTWTPDAHYLSSFGTNWPIGQPTHFKGSVVNQKTFHAVYWHTQFRMKASGGVGPGTDLSFWGFNCQGPNGVIAPLITGIFTTEATACKWPMPGSQEMDGPNFSAGNGNMNASMYNMAGGGAPLIGNFFGIDYFGTLWSNQVGTGNLFLAGNPVIDPTDGFHVYDVYWLPETEGGALAQWMYFVDGTMLAIIYANWIANTPMFTMLWNQDALAVVGPLPQEADWDYLRTTCPTGYHCPFTN